MKIKRFEAHNMSDALRVIKKEFGPDAVILSATTIKNSNRIFGSKKSGRVVVTAAIDREPVKTMEESKNVVQIPASAAKSAMGAAGTDTITTTRSSILDRFSPITRTGKQILQSKFVRPAIEPSDNDDFDETHEQLLHQRLTEQGVLPELVDDLVEQATGLFPANQVTTEDVLSALSQVITAKGWIASGVNSSRGERKIVVFTGPSGAGKTTAAVKLAAEAAMKNQRVALLSLDNRRTAGMVELERYAQLMGKTLLTAFEPEQVVEALDHCTDAQLVIVDTPGINLKETNGPAELKALLDPLNANDIHLLMPAYFQHAVMERTIAHFKPLAVNRLIFTQLDWILEIGLLINIIASSELPMAYFSDDPRVSEGIRPVTAQWLSRKLMNEATESVTTNNSVTVVTNRKPVYNHDNFVANCNSDIFHRPNCRSVQRINTQNIVVFKNEDEALGQSFKPCRMCCAELLAPKPLDRPARRSEAGNRYYPR